MLATAFYSNYLPNRAFKGVAVPVKFNHLTEYKDITGRNTALKVASSQQSSHTCRKLKEWRPINHHENHQNAWLDQIQILATAQPHIPSTQRYLFIDPHPHFLEPETSTSSTGIPPTTCRKHNPLSSSSAANPARTGADGRKASSVRRALATRRSNATQFQRFTISTAAPPASRAQRHGRYTAARPRTAA